MASSGQVAWLKYFKFNGNIETVMKKDSSVYDMSVITKKIGIIKAGTKVQYLSSKTFEQKAQSTLIMPSLSQ